MSTWGFKNSLSLDNNKYLSLFDSTGITKNNIIGVDVNNNLNINSASGDVFLNSNNSGSNTFINSSNSKNVFVNSKLTVGINNTSNINANITLVKNGFIGINTTRNSNDSFLGLAGSSSLTNTTGSRILLYGNDNTNGNSGNLNLYAGNSTAGSVNIFTGNDSNAFSILNSGTSNFSPNGSTIRLSINDTNSLFTHQVQFANTNISTSATTGSVLVNGGLGIVGDTFIAGTLNINSVTGNINFASTKDSINYTTGALALFGGLAIKTTTLAVSEENGGALTVAGGFGLGGNAILGGSLQSSGITTGRILSTGLTTGAILSTGLTTGDINFTGALYQNSVPYVGSQWTGTNGNNLYYGSGGSVFVGINTTNPTSTLDINGTLRSTNITSTNLVSTNISTGTINATTSTIPNVVSTNISTSTLSGSSSTIGSGLFTNLTVTNFITGTISTGSVNTLNSTITNLVSTNISTSTLSGSSITIGSGLFTNLTVTNFITGTISTGSVNTLNSTITNLVATTSTIPNTVSTNISSGTLSGSSSTIGSGLFTNLTVTNFITGTISTGSVYTPISTITNLVVTNISTGTISATTSTIPNTVSTNISTGTISATTSTIPNTVSTNISTGTINATTSTIPNTVSTNISTGTLSGSSSTIGSGLFTNLTVTNFITGTISTGSVNTLNSTITNLVVTNNSTSTINASNGTISNFAVTNNLLVGGSLIAVNVTTLNVINNNISTGSLSASTGITTSALLVTGLISASNLFSATSTIPNVVNTNISSGVLIASTGITSATLLVTGLISASDLFSATSTIPNIVHTNISTGVLVASTGISTNSLLATGTANFTFNSNTLGNIFTTGGNVGIGNSTPNVPLQFANTVVNRKIVLWDNTVNNDHQYYGFGINSATLRYQVADSGNHIFYVSTSTTTSNELMRIRGDGNVGIGTNNPTATLDVNGTFQSQNIQVFATAGNTEALVRSTISINGPNMTGLNSANTVYFSPNLQIKAPSVGTGQPLWNVGGAPTHNSGNLLLSAGDAPDNVNNGTALDNLVGGNIVLNGGIGYYQGGSGNAPNTTNGSVIFQTGFASTKNTSGNTFERMRIDGNTGNVGIGTPSPAYTLDITNATPILRLGTSIDGGGRIIFGNINHGIGRGINIGSASDGNDVIVYTAGTGCVALATGSIVRLCANNDGSVSIPGTLAKGAGSFDIEHPLHKNENKRLVHSFVEGPRCDNIYRGVTKLVSGVALINLDKECVEFEECSMEEGTFVALNKNCTFYLQNTSSFDRLLGHISGNILTITCENTSSDDNVNWMVVGERNDKLIKGWERTNTSGSLITEYLKQ